MAIRMNGYKANDAAVKYEVLEECGTLGKRGANMEIKLRYMKWNGKEAKYDLRLWKVDDDGNETALKGISLTGEELETLGDLIQMLQDEPEVQEEKPKKSTKAKSKAKAKEAEKVVVAFDPVADTIEQVPLF